MDNQMVFNFGAQPRRFERKQLKDISKQTSQNHCQHAPRYVNDTLHHDRNVPNVRDEIKNLGQIGKTLQHTRD